LVTNKDKKRILTGVRPTGALHLGHYVGALENWTRLQEEYDCFFLIADYQAMGDHLDDIEGIRRSVYEVTLDWLSVGLDPGKSSFVIQSHVPEHAELAMLVTPLGWLERNPTLKAERVRLESEGLSVGFYTYPVSQVADIALPKANLVPVGEDQVPHIEMTREVVRRFNRMFGQTFPEPDSLVGRVARLPGTDGEAKMSKSLGNVIYLSDEEEAVNQKVRSMYTDPNRTRADIPGRVEGNPVFAYHDAFNSDHDEVSDLKDRYTKGLVGDVEVKQKLANAINRFLDPIREKRTYYEGHPMVVKEALFEGTRKAKSVAEATMREVREKMGISYFVDES
jgi:tryptophanyl-tRNA synthetase